LNSDSKTNTTEREKRGKQHNKNEMMDNATKKKQTTKEYREKIRQRKIIHIPKRNDISLFQKQNCVEGLPIPIFQMIQEYCKQKDYRNLVNTNLSTFQPINGKL
jgi:hypothetical protein